MSMKIKLELLEPGDEAVGFSDNKITIKKSSGELEIFIISFDENNVPRIDERSILITYKSKSTSKASIIDDSSDFEVGSF